MMADDLPQLLFDPVSWLHHCCRLLWGRTCHGQTSLHFDKISHCCRGPNVQNIITSLHRGAARCVRLFENPQLALRPTESEDDDALAMLLPQLVDVFADYMELHVSEHPHSETGWRHPYDYLLRIIHRRLITPESYQYRTMSVVHFFNFQFWIAKLMISLLIVQSSESICQCHRVRKANAL